MAAQFPTTFSLNLYQMPLVLDDEQEDDCSQYNTQEMLCDMGLKI